MPLETKAQALALLKRARLVTLAAHVKGVPCLVEEVAGERVRGSWWGHPKGKLIFSLAEALEDSGQVLVVKLLEGKTTFVHASLWPALLAVVLDEGWRKARAKTLSPGGRALWKQVERASRRGGPPAAVKALEASLLVHCVSEHTERGRHERRLTSWGAWAREHGVRPAKLTVEEALAALGLPRPGRPHAT